jgi:hypothetical protein
MEKLSKQLQQIVESVQDRIEYFVQVGDWDKAIVAANTLSALTDALCSVKEAAQYGDNWEQ